MKKKFLSSLFAIGIGLLIFTQSCEKDLKIDEPVLEKDTLFVPISIAKSIAENVNYWNIFNNSTSNSDLKSTKSSNARQLQDSLTICDNHDKTKAYLYIFNYKSGGFIIISADKRTYPIMAFSDSGKFDMDLNALPFGLAQWIDKSAFNIKEKKLKEDKASPAIVQQWKALQNPTIYRPVKYSSVKSEPITPPQSSYIYTVGPLTKTSWSQGCYYNTYCPKLSDGPCGHAYTGCATTAIAQVMAYWKRPANYDWSGMSLTYGNDPIARLMGDIFTNVIDSYNSKDGSGCKNDFKIASTFKKFGYSSASLAGWVNLINYNGGFDDNKIIQNLISKQPVIVGGFQTSFTILGIPVAGSGHVWVVDGYKDCYIAGEDGIGGWNYQYYHINWGWGPNSYNGWFSMGNWSTPNGNYNCYNDMIYNIYH